MALDTTTLSSPLEIGNFDLYVINKITVVDNYAYVCSQDLGMYILDINQVADGTPPQVGSHIPDIDAVGVFPKSSINITFNENMEHAAAESAISIATTLAGEFSWSGTTMIFNPDGDMQPETTYTVTLATSAQDTAMNTLDGNQNGVAEGSPADDYSWQFQTSDLPPIVEEVFPENNTDFVPINSVVQINFSKAMDKSSTQSAFSFTDGINTWTTSSGQVTWSNGDMTMEFDPNANLDYEIIYTFTLDHTAQDTDSMALDGDGDGTGGEGAEDDYVWLFTTSPPSPQVVSSFPEGEAVDMPVDTVIVINFSKTMNRVSLQDAFSYTDGTNTYGSSDGTISWSNSDTTFTFTPNADLENAVQYTIKVSYEAEDTIGFQLDGDGDGIGGEGPEDDYSWSFTTIPIPPEVNSTSPSDGATLVRIDTSVIINFSKSMNKEETLAATEYTDGSSTYFPSEGQVVWTNNNMTLTFTPPSLFANEKIISFTVRSTARDEEGAYLDADGDGIGGEVDQDDYSFSFTTMHLPARVLQITPSKKATMVEVDTDIAIRFSRSMD
ncbi:MAG: Ig-like domain-containing protein, partial [Gammaproteobacteria bacterium]|nr:Ig-like domain-containing protein [Gammaproteobacteria bacterium]